MVHILVRKLLVTGGFSHHQQHHFLGSHGVDSAWGSVHIGTNRAAPGMRDRPDPWSPTRSGAPQRLLGTKQDFHRDFHGEELSIMVLIWLIYG